MHNLREVPLEHIDFGDRTLKISRNIIGEELAGSIRDFGILDPPLLIGTSPPYAIAMGFNRLQTARDLGRKSVMALSVEELTPRLFLDLGILKSYRSELGPMGKLKLISIMKERFCFSSDMLLPIGTAALNMPREFITGTDLSGRIERFPLSLKEYLDNRDINFRAIMDLCRLPEDSLQFLGSLVERGQVRVNIFRKIADMVHDISRRDGGAGGLAPVLDSALQAASRYDDAVHDLIFRIRYPGYSKKRERVMELVGRIPGGSVKIELPEYLEGDRISFSFSMGRRDDPEEQGKKISGIISGPVVQELLRII